MKTVGKQNRIETAIGKQRKIENSKKYDQNKKTNKINEEKKVYEKSKIKVILQLYTENKFKKI